MTLRIELLLGVCLAVLAGGCHSVPTIPPEAQAPGYSQNPQDGWLYQKLSSQGPSQPLPDDEIKVGSRSARGMPSLGKMDELEDPKPAFGLAALSPSNWKKGLKKAMGKGPNEGVAHALYDEGIELFGRQMYTEAAAKFAEAADRWPESPLEEDSLFMLGESHFFSDRYPKAVDAYGRLVKQYQYTRHLDVTSKRLFAIGRYWEQASGALPGYAIVNFSDKARPMFDTFGHGLKAYETIRLNDPTGPMADDAVMAAANAYFVRNRFEESAYHYGLIRKQYPKSEHLVKAHILEMKSKMNMYQGPQYDGAVLDDADEVAKQALMQFGKELGNERQWVIDTRNTIVQEKAMRDWQIGQYYERKGYYGAARYYYQTLLKDYPRTEVAPVAQKRLGEIQSYPEKPPDYFWWLTGLFETKRR
jgi:TolA-binding protein